MLLPIDQHDKDESTILKASINIAGLITNPQKENLTNQLVTFLQTRYSVLLLKRLMEFHLRIPNQ
jgi:hypothetical protein